MRMRKHIRYQLRITAEKAGVKPQKHISDGWDQIQVEKVGLENRRKNQARGTHKKHLWKSRIEAVLG